MHQPQRFPGLCQREDVVFWLLVFQSHDPVTAVWCLPLHILLSRPHSLSCVRGSSYVLMALVIQQARILVLLKSPRTSITGKGQDPPLVMIIDMCNDLHKVMPCPFSSPMWDTANTALSSLHGLRGSCRSLPIDKISQMLSGILGQAVNNANVKAALAGVFGPDASTKYVGWVQNVLKSGAVTSALGKLGPVCHFQHDLSFTPS
jgi:hypothetical protein